MPFSDPLDSAGKMRTADRIIILQPMPGKQPQNVLGLTDNRLFTGENKLHAVMDPQTCMWSMKYDSGVLPNPLKQHFTGFGKLLRFVTEYFNRRNIEVKEVIG